MGPFTRVNLSASTIPTRCKAIDRVTLPNQRLVFNVVGYYIRFIGPLQAGLVLRQQVAMAPTKVGWKHTAHCGRFKPAPQVRLE